MHHFAQGRKDLFVEALQLFEEWGEWDMVFRFCEEALAKDDEDGSPSLLGSDLRVWKAFITSAGKQPDDERLVHRQYNVQHRLTWGTVHSAGSEISLPG